MQGAGNIGRWNYDGKSRFLFIFARPEIVSLEPKTVTALFNIVRIISRG